MADAGVELASTRHIRYFRLQQVAGAGGGTGGVGAENLVGRRRRRRHSTGGSPSHRRRTQRNQRHCLRRSRLLQLQILGLLRGQGQLHVLHVLLGVLGLCEVGGRRP